MVSGQDPVSREPTADSTFGAGLPAWLGRLGHVRNVVRQASQPVIAELAAHVAPGGFLTLAVRTTTSAIWRPAARQDWRAALAAFSEYDLARAEGRDMRYINEIGTTARADDLAALTALATACGLQLENWYGVRIAVDPDELDPPPPSDPRQLPYLNPPLPEES